MKKIYPQKRSVEAWRINDLISKIESGELDLSTEYQRDIIWPNDKRGLLIDSILKDIDIPKIYIAHYPQENKYECIDGKQRISSILDFYNGIIPSSTGELYSGLKDNNKFLNYPLSMVVIENPTEENIAELFFRLNLGMPLNGAERLNAMTGEMRRFVFATIGKNGPFLKNLGIRAGKKYRFSRESTLAQMVINSIHFRQDDKFVRSRYEDLYEFFKENKRFGAKTKLKIAKILSHLKELEKNFGQDAKKLNGKAAIVSAYLFCEELIAKNHKKQLGKFPKFYIELLMEMKEQAKKIKSYQLPDKNKRDLLDNFQRNLQQASAEGYSIKNRQLFLREKFKKYLKSGSI